VELRHLRYFVAVAEMENVSRAAMQRLHVSQPSLSRQIRDLEDEMGVQLLERTAKSVRLTEAGRAFLDEARAILKHTDEAVGKVRAIAGKSETELYIGDWPLATAGIMPQLLRAYQQAMPNVRAKLHDWPVEKNRSPAATSCSIGVYRMKFSRAISVTSTSGRRARCLSRYFAA